MPVWVVFSSLAPMPVFSAHVVAGCRCSPHALLKTLTDSTLTDSTGGVLTCAHTIQTGHHVVHLAPRRVTEETARQVSKITLFQNSVLLLVLNIFSQSSARRSHTSPSPLSQTFFSRFLYLLSVDTLDAFLFLLLSRNVAQDKEQLGKEKNHSGWVKRTKEDNFGYTAGSEKLQQR